MRCPISRKSKTTRPYHGLQRLPVELHLQIFQYAANAWIHQYVDYMWFWKDPTGARVFLCFLYTDADTETNKNGYPRFEIKLPPLLFVSIASRSTMYYAILNYGAKEPVPTGKDIHLFFEQTGRHCSDMCVEPRPYGWQIQNFGCGGLKKRVRAEEKRLKEMKEEMDQLHEIVGREYYIERVGPLRTTAEKVANVAGELKPRSPGYLRLPLYNQEWTGPPGSRAPGYMDVYNIYPAMPKIEVWGVRCEKGWRPLPGYFKQPCLETQVPEQPHRDEDACSCILCEEESRKKAEKKQGFCRLFCLVGITI